jgi:hypothetical protein
LTLSSCTGGTGWNGSATRCEASDEVFNRPPHQRAKLQAGTFAAPDSDRGSTDRESYGDAPTANAKKHGNDGLKQEIVFAN